MLRNKGRNVLAHRSAGNMYIMAHAWTLYLAQHCWDILASISSTESLESPKLRSRLMTILTIFAMTRIRHQSFDIKNVRSRVLGLATAHAGTVKNS
jgi:hypothetical protein